MCGKFGGEVGLEVNLRCALRIALSFEDHRHNTTITTTIKLLSFLQPRVEFPHELQ